jgi:RecJ-like exonuclease
MASLCRAAQWQIKPQREPACMPVGCSREGDFAMSEEPMNPGDQAPPGTPGTGQDICPKCNGSGQLQQDDCEFCGGTGKIIRGIGGA